MGDGVGSALTCVSHCVKHLVSVNSSNPHISWDILYFPLFSQMRKIKAQKSQPQSHGNRVVQLGIQTQVCLVLSWLSTQSSFHKIKCLRLVSWAKFILFMPNSNFYSLPNFTICSYILSFIKVLTIAEAPIWYKPHFSSEGTNTNNLPKFTHRSCNAKFRTQAKVLPRMTLPHANSMKLGDYSTTSTEHGKCKLTRAPKWLKIWN